ncbi:MAG: three-Cys-motif partner protein TcmP, partial [Nanoarchaeota archaeon]|nr:three-Cys-motif partner protein TcmP [Nanoarchaeota archaeon]
MFLEYYIKPFLDVSINKGFSCYYIDFFSGCGANCVGCGDKKSVGSPIISLIKGIYFNKRKQQHSRFNKWFFIDSNKQYCDALSDRVAKVSQHIYDNTTQNDGVSVSLTLDEDISIINKDCNKAIVDIVTEINNCEKKISVLAFIDPFNYKNIIWQTWIELLKLKYVDIIFTMPISAMKRGLDQDKNCKKYLLIIKDRP